MLRATMIRTKRFKLGLLALLVIAGCSTNADTDTDTPASDPGPSEATPRSDLSVALTLHQSAYMQGDAVIADVTITNLTKHNVKLLSWFVPSSDLEESTFVVTHGGARSDFMGPHYKRPNAVDHDFVHVAAGASITGQVDLARFYDFSTSGDYAVRFELDINDLVPSLAGTGQLVSNAETIWVEARPAPAPAPPTSGSCSATQQAQIAQAITDAGTISSGARDYLSGSPSATQRYTTWFGSFSNAGWALAHDHFVSIADAFATKPITVDCKCKKQYYAYVYPNQPYQIYVCKAFWTAPATGTDSKAGTLVHEMSHFNVTAGTDDHVYGQTGCKDLALTDPAAALDNADSHEYFSENTPFQP